MKVWNTKLRLIKRCAEFISKDKLDKVPHKTRGIYVLYQGDDGKTKTARHDVVYVGMAGAAKSGIHGRLKAHASSKRKQNLWSHFSFFEVWHDVKESEVRELEGIIRHIYRRDRRANILNTQKGFNALRAIRDKTLG